MNSTVKTEYIEALQDFDAAICEATAVSQASSGRMAPVNIGYASYVFTGMCGVGTSLVRAAPYSRWVRSEFQNWHFSAIAGHARSILDGYLLFNYLIAPSSSEFELQARINIMHLKDCVQRIRLHKNIGSASDIEGFEAQRDELCERIKGNDYFNSLPEKSQKNFLNGKYLTLENRDEILTKVGFKKNEFDALYDLWSQHIHILPMSFYRTEANGRGTGIENDVDRGYMAAALKLCAAILTDATDSLVILFPNAAGTRKGIKSEFSPGPIANRRRISKVLKGAAMSPPFSRKLFIDGINKN